MCVWRIPLPFFAALIASTSLAVVWIGIASLRRRAQLVIFRGILAGAAVVAAILSPFLVYAITADELEKMFKLGVYVHYSSYLYFAPLLVVTLLFGASRVLFPRRGSTSVARWHLKFWVIAFAFTVLNIANWCNPAWCERFGFPFRYSWRSDAVIIMNGTNHTAGRSLIALIANIALLFFVVAAVAFSYRRSLKPRPTAGDVSRSNAGRR